MRCSSSSAGHWRTLTAGAADEAVQTLLGSGAGILVQSGGVNRWADFREPVPLDRQAAIRMNRDTRYGAGIVDLSREAAAPAEPGDGTSR